MGVGAAATAAVGGAGDSEGSCAGAGECAGCKVGGEP